MTTKFKTKYKFSKNNKTRKRFTGKSIPDSLDTTKNLLYNQLDREKALACYLANNDVIKNFTFNLFYFLLNYWRKNVKNWSYIIKHSLIQDINNKIIQKIGFTDEEFNIIIEYINSHNKKQFFEFINDKFFKVTSSLNSLVEPEYTIYHVEFNKNLQKKFIKQLKKLMLIKDISWKDIKQFYSSLKNNKERSMYNFFIFDIIYSSDKTVETIYRNNLGNMIFFRERLTVFKHNKSNYIKINNCNKSIISDTDFFDYGIYNSTERYSINKHSPYYNIMNKYNASIIGGPSGSTSLMYITLFNFYLFPFTYRNKILLLGILIADYIPLWHSIPEILLSAYPEMKETKIKKYTLEQNSVKYCVDLLKPFIQ
jgi:hypothetical protein